MVIYMRALIIWILLSIGLFLFPGPSFWYNIFHGFNTSEGYLLSLLGEKVQLFFIYLEEHEEIKQLLAHFILMMGCAFCLSKEISSRMPVTRFNSWAIITITILFVLLLSFLIEVMQSLLPVSFERGFDWMDIVFSLLGGLLGGIITLVVNRR